MLGGAISVLPGDTSSQQSAIAVLRDDTPIVAFRERATPGGNADVFVMRWRGTEWELMGGLLSAHPGASFADWPALTVDEFDRPVVAWEERPEGGQRGIPVYRHEAGSWTAVGDPQSGQPGDTDANLPAVATRGSRLVTCWHEADGSTPPINSRVFASEWDGTAWVGLGEPLDKLPGATRGIRCDIALHPGDETAYVAWMEMDTAGRFGVHVARHDGSEWIDLPDPPPGFSEGAGPSVPQIAFDPSGRLHIAFHDADSSGAAANHIFVRRWNGTDWDDFGSPSMALPGLEGGSNTPGLAFDQVGRPLVAFRGDGSLGGIYVRRYNGTAWVAVGRLGAPGMFTPVTEPSLTTTACGDPVVSWQGSSERSGPSNVYAARYVR